MPELLERGAVEPSIDRTTPPDDLPFYLRVEEFAAYLGIGRGLAYEMARSDPRLRAVRFGRLLRIPRDALAALVGENK